MAFKPVIGGKGLYNADGATGAQGNQGFQGTAGGAQGNQGSAGAQGAAGGTGSQGFQGAQGGAGSQGAQGATGSGSQGNQGATGAQGAQGGGVSNIDTGNTLWVDAVNGDNTAAHAAGDYDFAVPFLTLAGAQAQADSGDTIYVRPGSYTATTSILKTGVNWHFEAGAVVTQTPANTDTTGILNDASGITSRITGAGKFVLNCTGRDGLAGTTIVTLNTPDPSDFISIYAANGDRFNFWFSVDAVGSAPGVGGTDVEVALAAGFTNADASAALGTVVNATATCGYSSADGNGFVTLTSTTEQDRTDSTSSNGTRLPISNTEGYAFQQISLVTSHASSSIWIECYELEVIYPGADVEEGQLPTVILQNGPINITANRIVGTGDFTTAILWKNGKCSVTAPYITAGYYGVWSQVTDTPTGDLFITCDQLICVSSGGGSLGCPIFSSGDESTAAYWITAKTVTNAGTAAPYYAVYTLGTEKGYLIAEKISGYINLTSGQFHLDVQKLAPSHSTMGLINVSCRAFTRIGMIDVTGYSAITIGANGFSGENVLEIGSVIGASDTVGLSISSGTFLRNSTIDLSAGTNKTAVTVGSGTPIIQNCVLIGTGTGKDVNVTGGSCKVINSSGSGTSGLIRRSGAANLVNAISKLKDFVATVSSTGTDGSSYIDLFTFTTAVDTMAVNGDVLKAEYYILTVAQATATRQVRVKFAGTVIYDSDAVITATAASVKIEVTIIRTGSSTARAMVTATSSSATFITKTQETDLTGLTFTNTNIILIEGVAGSTGAASGDVAAKLGSIWYIPAAF